MTSPRQKKKRIAYLRAKEKQNNQTLPVVEKVVEQKPVDKPAEPVLDLASKLRKTKNALVETKPQEQVVEQKKEEVKTETTKE